MGILVGFEVIIGWVGFGVVIVVGFWEGVMEEGWE